MQVNYILDGTNLRLAGPSIFQTVVNFRFQVASVLDTQSITNYVVKMFVGGNPVGVHSNNPV